MPLTVTPSALNVVSGNPGLTFSDAQLNQMVRGTLVLSTGSGHGCITHLRYGDNDRDLDMITLSDGGTTKSYSSADLRNLAEFRERLQEAANFGHRVTFCIDTEQKRMFMLNIFPCGCPCKKD
jgi:hypothetical protein